MQMPWREKLKTVGLEGQMDLTSIRNEEIQQMNLTVSSEQKTSVHQDVLLEQKSSPENDVRKRKRKRKKKRNLMMEINDDNLNQTKNVSLVERDFSRPPT